MAVKKRLVMLFFVTAVVSLAWGANEVIAQAEKGPVIRKMSITGQIGKVGHGYVIRGTSKSVIFTVLNPEPEILDGLVKSGKDVNVDVHIVSGDNVNIEKINGEPYTPKKGGAVRNMSLIGQIGKVGNGYVIRGTSKSVIFTVLNPSPKLDEFVKSGKTVKVDVRIVSGDNVNVEMVDGEKYP